MMYSYGQQEIPKNYMIQYNNNNYNNNEQFLYALEPQPVLDERSRRGSKSHFLYFIAIYQLSEMQKVSCTKQLRLYVCRKIAWNS